MKDLAENLKKLSIYTHRPAYVYGTTGTDNVPCRGDYAAIYCIVEKATKEKVYGSYSRIARNKEWFAKYRESGQFVCVDWQPTDEDIHRSKELRRWNFSGSNAPLTGLQDSKQAEKLAEKPESKYWAHEPMRQQAEKVPAETTAAALDLIESLVV